MRLPFLILTPACVMLGAGTAAWSGSELNLYYLALTFVGAVAAHISVNALNEYDDCKSGLDFNTQRTPFSGGSGTLPQSPDKAHVALITGLFSLVVTAIVGVYFLYVRGLWLLPVGLVGLVIIVVYTKWITKNAVLCLIAPGLGFGPLMVMGTDFVLTGCYSWTSFVASLVPFFLVSNLLLLNQFPDVEADKGVGRHHFPIAIGREASVRLYVCIPCRYVSGDHLRLYKRQSAAGRLFGPWLNHYCRSYCQRCRQVRRRYGQPDTFYGQECRNNHFDASIACHWSFYFVLENLVLRARLNRIEHGA